MDVENDTEDATITYGHEDPLSPRTLVAPTETPHPHPDEPMHPVEESPREKYEEMPERPIVQEAAPLVLSPSTKPTLANILN